jgi:trigger factor
MNVGDEKTLELSFPEDYHNEELKGAAVEFQVTLNTVSEQVMAPLDEALFKQYGVEDGGEEQFRQEIVENMERELATAVKNKVKQQVMDAIIEAHQGQEVPKALIDQEIGKLRQQMFQQFGGAGGQDLDLESLLPAEMFQDQAERRVKLGLILSELVAKAELTADPDKVRAAIEEIASTYQEPEQVVQWYYSNQEQLSGIESMVLEDQVVENILDNAKLTEEACSYQDALAQAQENQQV